MPKGVYDRSRISRENKREEILKAAAKVYAHFGFEGATLDRMAAEAGVSKALVLNYFESKQGLVKAIASRAVSENMEKIRRIDETGGLTLREREQLIHELMGPAREEWCLILGTLLVPNFQFQQRGEISEILSRSHRIIMVNHLNELRDPGYEAALAFACSSIGLHIGYIFAGREDDYRIAMDHLMNLYLYPEEVILKNRHSSADPS